MSGFPVALRCVWGLRIKLVYGLGSRDDWLRLGEISFVRRNHREKHKPMVFTVLRTAMLWKLIVPRMRRRERTNGSVSQDMIATTSYDTVTFK